MVFTYSVSLQGYKEKITKEGFSKVIYKKKSTNEDTYLDDLCKEIKSGHVFAHVFKVKDEQRFTSFRNFSNSNFLSTNIVPMDLDSVSIEMDDLIKNLTIQPTILYTTFSHEDKPLQRRYRLLYVFNNPINGKQEYQSVYDAIASKIREDLKGCEELDDEKLDIHMRNCTQVFIGSKSNCDLINNYTTYDKRRFISISGSNSSKVDNVKMNEVDNSIKTHIETNRDTLTNTTKKEKPKTNNNNSTKNSNSNDIYDSLYYSSKWKTIEEEYTITNSEFIELFKSMHSKNVSSALSLLKDFKNNYPIFDSEEIEFNEDGYSVLKEDYKSIIRIWEYDAITRKNNIKKVKVGNRKKHLFNNALRFLALREISFDHLLYLLCNEACNYFEKPKEFYLNEVFDVAFDAYKTNLEGKNFIFFAPNEKKIKVDKDWCLKNGMSAKSLARHAQKVETDKKIAEFYDENLSVKENLKILQENGVEVKKSKLYNYIKELNLPQISIKEICKKTSSKYKHKIDNNAQTEKYFENERNDMHKTS